MRKNFISIDWGGTSLKGVCVTEQGATQTFGLASKNLRVTDKDEMLLKINQLVKLITGLGNCGNYWLIGAAGAKDENAIERLKRAILAADNNLAGIEVYPDYESNFAACFENKSGVLSVNGTGSVLYGINFMENLPCATATYGGWGYLLDELPSGGFWGRLALCEILSYCNGNELARPFYELAKERGIETEALKTVSAQLLVNALYQTKFPQQALSRYAPILSELYQKGNTRAEALILRSIEELTTAFSIIQKKIKLDRLQICGVGGLWRELKFFKKLVEARLRAAGLEFELVEPKFDLEWGPLVLFSKSNEVAQKIMRQREKQWQKP